MVSNIFVILISIIFICCALSLGYAFGKISSTNNTVKANKTESHCVFTNEELERMHIWG